MRRYDTYYDIVQTRRRRCCEAATDNCVSSGYEYDDVTVTPMHRECYKHDDECWYDDEPQCNHDGCYINDDDTVRFTIYQ